MTKLQEIKDEVVKVFPEVMELGLGCVVKIDYNVAFNITLDGTPCKVIDTEKALHNGNIFIQTFDFAYREIEEKHIKEILGKPITLEHILGVIKRNKTKELLSPNLKTLSEFWEVQKIIDFWILGKDLNWHAEHRPETISFIHSLLFDK